VVILWLAGPYVRTPMSEAAKDHYPLVKRGLRNLATRVSDPDAVSGSAHYVRSTEARRLMGAAPETSKRYPACA
jgi:hypothetical protein